MCSSPHVLWPLSLSPARLQDGANPAIIPRNHVMVGIISEAEQGNYQPLHRCAALRAAVGSSCLFLTVAGVWVWPWAVGSSSTVVPPPPSC